MPGASRASGASSMAMITSVRAPCRSANAKFHTTSSTARAKKLNRLMARLMLRRGCSQLMAGRGLAILATGVLQLLSQFRQAQAKGAAQGGFVFIECALAVGAGMVAWAVGCAAAAGAEQCAFAVRQAADQHAVAQQRQEHRQQGGFLAAMQAGGAGGHAGRFADQAAGKP